MLQSAYSVYKINYLETLVMEEHSISNLDQKKTTF